MDVLKNRENAAKKITYYGMIVNFLLVIFKFTSGILGRSSALVADAIHSLSDFISDIIVIVGFKLTSKPADSNHNYGHGKIETVSTVLIGLLLILLSISLIISSGSAIYLFFFENKAIDVPKAYVLYAVIASIVSKEILFQVTHIVGKRIKSEALMANAWHHRSDALSSVAALVGILMALLFGKDFAVCDPIASFVVSLFIFKVGIEIILSSYNQLLDASLKEEELSLINHIIESVEGIKGFHNVRTRRIGYYVSIDVHIFVDKDLSIEAAHDIASNLENKIYESFGSETYISVHTEPFYENYLNQKEIS